MAVAGACGAGALAVVLFWVMSPALRRLDEAVAESEANQAAAAVPVVSENRIVVQLARREELTCR